jgi:FkbM family methyltransferase
MDFFWQSTVDFLIRHQLTGDKLIAPIELSDAAPIGFSYQNTSAGPAGFTTLVLHKGQYESIAPATLRDALARLPAVFANEVFIVLSRGAPPLDADNRHLGVLADARRWSESAGRASMMPKSAAPRPRMPATYVGNGLVLAETAQGHLVTIPSDDRAITPHVIRDGNFDIGISRFIERTLRPGHCFVDVGANIGLYSLIAAAAVGERGRVIAIEPLQQCQTLIYDNLAMNGFEQRLTLVRCAVGEAAGEAVINSFPRYLGASTLDPGVAERFSDKIGGAPTPQTIKLVPLPDILREARVERPDLIKIDVEGYETAVLAGARAYLAAQPRIDLLMEWHPAFRSREDSLALLDFLTNDLGLSLAFIQPDGSALAATRDTLMALEHADIWARRQG